MRFVKNALHKRAEPYKYEVTFVISALMMLVSVAALILSRTISIGAAAVLLILMGAAYLAVWLPQMKKATYPLLLIAAAYAAECMMQLQIEHHFALVCSYQRIIDYLLYLLVFALFSSVAKRKSNGILFGSVFFFLISTLNLAVTVFRGKPVYFPDIYSAGTALDVAGAYSFPVSKVHLISAVLVFALILLCVACRQSGEESNGSWKKRVLRSAGILLIPTMIVSLRIPTLLKLRGYYFSTTEYWLYSFSMSAYQMQVVPPDGYDAEVLPIGLNQCTGEADAAVRPNVLFIMNESFADLRIISDFEEGYEAMPFFDELAKSDAAAVGNLYTSIFGGNTANTEFEVLTGISMRYLPYDTTAYNLYLNSQTNSLADYFASLGYQTVAFHPSAATNYNRINVYPNLGFQRSLFQEDFDDLETLRTFTSDISNYDKVIELFGNKAAGTPIFVFNVTVQNHGPFDIHDDAFDKKVIMDDAAFPVTEQYLSCLKYSDEALQYLLTYLEAYPEPVAVVFFGDHQAKIEDAFYERLFGKTLAELSDEENRMRYDVPYMIWTNYGLTLEDDVDMSANYLGAYVLEQLGLPQTEYQTFLNDLRLKYPVITLHSIVSADGVSEDDVQLLAAYEKNKLQFAV